MNQETAVAEVEKVIQLSEVKAVARAIRSGRRPRLGETIDYYVPQEPFAGSGRCGKPYRVAVEQWHLDAAERL